MADQKLLYLSGGGKLLIYNDFTDVSPHFLRYGLNDYLFSSYGNHDTFDCYQYNYNLYKFYINNSLYYGLTNNDSGEKIVKENESIMLTYPEDMIPNTGPIIANTDFTASIVNYLRAHYNVNTKKFTYDDAIYTLSQDIESSGSQESIIFYVSYCGMDNVHNNTLGDISSLGYNGATYDYWANEIYPQISNAIDWEYSQNIPTVTSTFAESNAANKNYVTTYKMIRAYQNIGLMKDENSYLPEIDSILILAPLYVTGIRVKVNYSLEENYTVDFSPIFVFNFCNVFIMHYDDITAQSDNGYMTQDISIDAYNINITAKNRSNTAIYGKNKTVQINDWLS